jgi:tRNA A-37 threonylcarbamoyl transferase component Bud32
MDDRTSQRFGRYEILSELGRGAMGVVYKARDPKINRIVAVKTISMAGQSAEEESEYRERFFREAEAAGRLSHPGIVTIFDVGEEAETRAPYIVMEFVGGESLDKLLAKDDRKLAVPAALQLARELADALDCAHRLGVVHRDLKPANILMTEDGHAKIADFGVAKLNLANHTLAGRALGTPAYMSPEQLNGEAVDGRSDLFSLGVILYTVLTGHRPFQGNSAITVSFKVVNRDPIPATLLDTELPAGLDHIIERAMAKDPTDRYQRGAEMVLDIQNLQAGQKRGSKAKEASSPATGAAAPTVKVDPGPPVIAPPVPRQPAPVPVIAAKPQPVARPATLSKEGLEKLRKASFAGVLALAGLFILGLWVISFGPPGVRPRAAEPVRPVSVKATAPRSAPATSVAALSDTPPLRIARIAVTPVAVAPVTKKSPKPRPPRRASPPPATVARASLPQVSPVITPVVTPPISFSASSAISRSALLAASPSASAALSPPASSAVFAPVSTAPLEIEVDHRFDVAHLSIWVDGSLTYTRVLEGTHKKRLGVFHYVQGHEIHVMPVSSGKHRLRVRVTSGSVNEAATEAISETVTEGPIYDQSAFVDGEFTSGKENVLRITFNKRGEINLNLK